MAAYMRSSFRLNEIGASFVHARPARDRTPCRAAMPSVDGVVCRSKFQSARLRRCRRTAPARRRSSSDAGLSRLREPPKNPLAQLAGVPTLLSHDVDDVWETKMKFALIGAAAVIGAAFATPALAQAVISDPGYCAQYYPNANCQNLGPGNPYTDGGYYRDDNWQNGNATMPRHAVRHTHRHEAVK